MKASLWNIPSLTAILRKINKTFLRNEHVADSTIAVAKLKEPGASFQPGVIINQWDGSGVKWIAFQEQGVAIRKTGSVDPVVVKYGGTTFPSSPVQGQWFTHDTHEEHYFYSADAGGWLSATVYPIPFEFPVDASATNYLAWFGTTAFTDTFGEIFKFATKVVGISMCMQTSGTATVQVFDDGSGVSGATLALSSLKSKADMSLMAGPIATDSIIGVKVTSGTVEGAGRGTVFLRRFET